jgi:hypothetical protein
MPAAPATLERNLFRAVNALVEPAVRRGVGSPRFTPLSLIVLESTGFKSGARRRTPLWSCLAGRYRIVSTARGDRSFWVRNLQARSQVRYFVGGRAREARAIVIAPGHVDQLTDTSPPLLRAIVSALGRFPRKGWAFAVLVPEQV